MNEIRKPWGEFGEWIHVETGWIVDPATGYIYGTRNGSKGRRLGSPNRNGAIRITRRYTDKSFRIFYAHTLVWEVTHDQRVPEDHYVAHLNDNQADCRPANLELRYLYKLTPEQINEIRQSIESTYVLGRRYGVHSSSISRIRTGRHWKED